MRFALGLLLAITSSISAAQSMCTAANTITVDHRDGVTAKVVTLESRTRKFTAHAFIPDRQEPVPGFAFSHSAIQYPDTVVDLLTFARAIARGGSAIVMLDRTMNSDERASNTETDPGDVACAAHWLMSNAKLDPDRLSIGGPMRWPMAGVAFCPDESTCWMPSYVFYWVTDHEEVYARKMKTPDGQLWMIRNLPDWFGQGNVSLEWLTESASRDNRPSSRASVVH